MVLCLDAVIFCETEFVFCFNSLRYCKALHSRLRQSSYLQQSSSWAQSILQWTHLARSLHWFIWYDGSFNPFPPFMFSSILRGKTFVNFRVHLRKFIPAENDSFNVQFTQKKLNVQLTKFIYSNAVCQTRNKKYFNICFLYLF